MRKSVLALAIGAFMASPGSHAFTGPNLTYGQSSNVNTIYVSDMNAGALGHTSSVGKRAGWGFGGQVDAVYSGVSGAEDYFDDNIQSLLDKSSPTVLDALALKDNVNTYLDMFDGAGLSVSGRVDMPVLYQQSGWGGFSLQLSKEYGGAARIIKNGDMDVTVDIPASSYSFDGGDAGLSIDYKEISALSLGFGKVLSKEGGWTMSAGLKANLYSAKASTQIVDFSQVLTDSIGGGGVEMDDYITDMEPEGGDTGFGFDVGLMASSENLTLGVALKNINTPEFDIEDLSTTQASSRFAGDIENSFALEPLMTASLSWHDMSQNWFLSGAADLNEVSDINQSPSQWYSLSLAYSTNGAWYIPDVRVGLRDNMADELDAYRSVGVTLGLLNIDVSATTFDFSNDDKAGVSVSAGIELDF